MQMKWIYKKEWGNERTHTSTDNTQKEGAEPPAHINTPLSRWLMFLSLVALLGQRLELQIDAEEGGEALARLLQLLEVDRLGLFGVENSRRSADRRSDIHTTTIIKTPFPTHPVPADDPVHQEEDRAPEGRDLGVRVELVDAEAAREEELGDLVHQPWICGLCFVGWG
jgi:hypothetical protein